MCRTEAQALLKEYPQLSLKAKVIQAAQLGREGKLAEAQALLNTCVKEYPDQATEIQLMTTQILLAKVSLGNTTQDFSTYKTRCHSQPLLVHCKTKNFSNFLHISLVWFQSTPSHPTYHTICS